MTVGPIARELAATTSTISTFAGALGTTRIDVSVGYFQSSGYARPGEGAGLYVSDDLATQTLATSHPRFCRQSADKRYWRLLPDEDGAIAVEQGGAVGDGTTNDQPALQDAIAYANAVGIREVRLSAKTYALRAPLRANGLGGLNGAGNYLVTRENLLLRGVRGRTLIKLYNSNGGPNTAVTQTVDSATWRGSAFYAWPNSTIDWVALEDVEFDGGLPYAGMASGQAGLDLTHKGFRVQDMPVRRILLRNVTMRNFGGEIFYCAGGMNIDEVLTENCLFDGSPQSAFNPGGAGSRGVHINLQAGNSYQAAELIGNWGQTIVGGRFYDSAALSMQGGHGGSDTGNVAGYHYSYSWRRTTGAPPWIDFKDTRIEHCNNVFLSSYVRGKLVLVDSPASFTNYGKLTDIDLDLECWADRKTGNWHALSVYGVANTTTQVPSCPGGVYYETPRNISIRVAGHRTAKAVADGNKLLSLMLFEAGLLDAATCRFTLAGEADFSLIFSGTPPAGFAWPLIDSDDYRSPAGTSYGAYNQAFPTAAFNLTLWPGANMVNPQASGIFDMTLVNTWPFQQGQKARVYNLCDSATSRAFRLAKSGAEALLSEDRTIWRHSDYIDLRWDVSKASWIEAGYSTQVPLRFAGSVTYDAPSIAAGGSATTTVTVTGAQLGMKVDRISFGVSLAGLVATGYVSAADTVTIVLQNPTGGAVNLASTTLAVEVAR